MSSSSSFRVLICGHVCSLRTPLSGFVRLIWLRPPPTRQTRIMYYFALQATIIVYFTIDLRHNWQNNQYNFTLKTRYPNDNQLLFRHKENRLTFLLLDDIFLFFCFFRACLSRQSSFVYGVLLLHHLYTRDGCNRNETNKNRNLPRGFLKKYLSFVNCRLQGPGKYFSGTYNIIIITVFVFLRRLWPLILYVVRSEKISVYSYR